MEGCIVLSMRDHAIETNDGWTCTVCGGEINGYPGRDNGDSVRHIGG